MAVHISLTQLDSGPGSSSRRSRGQDAQVVQAQHAEVDVGAGQGLGHKGIAFR
jgi:hypothetical protein